MKITSNFYVKFVRYSPKTSLGGQSAVKRSSRLRDPEVAAKHKAFLQKVVTATNGSMDTYLSQENMETEDSGSAQGLKRKLSTTSKGPDGNLDEASNNKRRKSSRTSNSGGSGVSVTRLVDIVLVIIWSIFPCHSDFT